MEDNDESEGKELQSHFESRLQTSCPPNGILEDFGATLIEMKEEME